jgi:hypothetical protein
MVVTHTETRLGVLQTIPSVQTPRVPRFAMIAVLLATTAITRYTWCLKLTA